MKLADGTPVAEDLREAYATAKGGGELAFMSLIERTSRSEERERATNQRLDSMAHEPFNTPEELMQDLVRENSEFTNTIVKLRERERMLRTLLEQSRFDPDEGMFPDKYAEDKAAALASAPEQPAAPCGNCGHANPHNRPGGEIEDMCDDPDCNCGYFAPE